MGSNTAKLIIRKTKTKHLEKLNDSNQYSLTKTDEKQKPTPSDTQQTIANFRKYKKPHVDISETNVLGQPKT